MDGMDSTDYKLNDVIHKTGSRLRIATKGAPRRTHWTHVRPKEILTKFSVVSISTAYLLEVVLRHFRV